MARENSYRAIVKRTRAKLFAEQRGLCFYCAKPMLLCGGVERGENPPRMATLDHIVPLSSGGARAPTLNTVAACLKCNRERGTKDARLFMLEKQGG